ncbi:transposase [Actinospica durhamensis]|uniref:Transposase n=1 Tax=Actinospica durhamensis TaxID=1508375 RepID=A0A941IS74_9ACTN|nr:transposase [Actinospica durhamensis]
MVARQYSGTLGKTGNRQVGVTTHLATDSAFYPVTPRTGGCFRPRHSGIPPRPSAPS